MSCTLNKSFSHVLLFNLMFYWRNSYSELYRFPRLTCCSSIFKVISTTSVLFWNIFNYGQAVQYTENASFPKTQLSVEALNFIISSLQSCFLWIESLCAFLKCLCKYLRLGNLQCPLGKNLPQTHTKKSDDKAPVLMHIVRYAEEAAHHVTILHLEQWGAGSGQQGPSASKVSPAGWLSGQVGSNVEEGIW